MKKRVVHVDVKSWGREDSYNPKTGRKDVLQFVAEQLGEKEIERLDRLKVQGVSVSSRLIDVNDRQRGEERRNNIRSLLKQAGISVRFKNVTRHTAGKLKK